MKRLIIECGAAETRAALIDGERVVRFWLGPARGDEKDDLALRKGRHFIARVLHVDRDLKAAFLDIGDAHHAFLPLDKTNTSACVEGALLEVRVKSPPRQGKGAAVKFVATSGAEKIGLAGAVAGAAIDAARALGEGAEEIVIDDGAAARGLESEQTNARIVHDNGKTPLFERFGAEAAFSDALNRTVALKGGGALVIDESHALTAIDVDTGSLHASSAARLREKVAYAAADEAIDQLALRNIGGHVVIDFPSLKTDAARKRFAAYLKKTLTELPGATAASFSKSGLFSFTLPRGELSLLDHLTEPSASEPVPGRRFTQAAATRAAIRALEHRLHAAPSARFTLFIGADVATCLEAKPQWRARLEDKFGARFKIELSKRLGERDHDLREQ